MKLLKWNAILTSALVILSQTPTQAQVIDPEPLQKSQSRFGTQSDAAPPPPPDIGKPKKLADAGGRMTMPLIFAAPPPPSGIGAPGRRRDGGGRPSCQQESQSSPSENSPLTALVPTSPSGVVSGLTIADRPTFWFYSPYSSAMDGVLVLEDEMKQQTEYKMTLIGTPGVIRFTLPPTAAPLVTGKLYHWYFKVYCKDDHTQSIAFVEGNLQRQPLNATLKSQLNKASGRDRAALYATNGIWYEALETAAELRRSNAEEPSWASLLRSVGLEDIAQKPVVDCCKQKQEF